MLIVTCSVRVSRVDVRNVKVNDFAGKDQKSNPDAKISAAAKGHCGWGSQRD